MESNGLELSNGLKLSAKSSVSGSQRNAREALEWFAMSATFGRALKAKETIESHSIRCFVPMKYAIVSDHRQGKVRRLVPAISNLIFVYTTKTICRREHIFTCLYVLPGIPACAFDAPL